MRGWTARACALLVAQVVAQPAWAQPTDPTQPSSGDLAIQKGRDGVALFERGEWDKALVQFREAEALFHSPVLLLYAARSLRNLGRLLEARKAYQALAKETIAPSAPPTWQKAQLDGAAELASVETEIPRVVVTVEGRRPTTRATLDGQAIVLDARTEADPGEHRVVVVDGQQTLYRTIRVQRGESSPTVSFTLPTLVPPGADDSNRLMPAAEAKPRGWRVLGIAMTSAGGASLVAGGIVGGFALHEASSARADLPQGCTADRKCPSFEQAHIEARFEKAYTLANVADVLLIGGGVATAAGVILLLVDPGRTTVAAHAASRNGDGLLFRF